MTISEAKKGQMFFLIGPMEVFAYIKTSDVSQVIIIADGCDYSISVPYYLQFSTLSDFKQLIINEFYEAI